MPNAAIRKSKQSKGNMSVRRRIKTSRPSNSIGEKSQGHRSIHICQGIWKIKSPKNPLFITSTKLSITQLIIIRFKFLIARNLRTIKAHLLIASDLLNENMRVQNRAECKIGASYTKHKISMSMRQSLRAEASIRPWVPHDDSCRSSRDTSKEQNILQRQRLKSNDSQHRSISAVSTPHRQWFNKLISN